MFSGKVAIVTGGAKGIGRGCAEVLAANGGRVAIVDVDREAGEDLARQMGPEQALFAACDVSNSQQVQQMIACTVERFGRLDLLINNAGYHISKSVEETTEAEWDYLIDTNLRSVFLCSKYAIPHLKRTRGTIINMSSMVGLVGQTNAGAYSASKGGVIGMTRNMALDLAPFGVRVNCICPGWVATPLVEDWFGQQSDPAASRKYIYGAHPLGRIATTEEIGRVALFLASEQSAFITGAALPVEGGLTLGY